MSSLFRRKLIDPIVHLLVQGITPEKIALSLALGIVISTLPILGSGTLLCTIAAIALRLNLPAIQIANWLAYPLQILLLIPFFHLGAVLFGQEPMDFSPHELIAMFKADFWGSITALWSTTWQACVAWLILSPIAATAFYFALVWLLRRTPLRQRTEAAT